MIIKNFTQFCNEYTDRDLSNEKLYHFMPIGNLISSESGFLSMVYKNDWFLRPDLKKTRNQYVSFTSNANLTGFGGVRLEFDRTKLSKDYKLEPYLDVKNLGKDGLKKGEDEERVKIGLKNGISILNYLKMIRVASSDLEFGIIMSQKNPDKLNDVMDKIKKLQKEGILKIT